jgi:hypothetical protein
MDELRRIITNLNTRLENIEKGLVIKKITIPTDGYVVVKKVASDPGSPVEGEIWLNTTSHAMKTYVNGAVKTFTLT